MGKFRIGTKANIVSGLMKGSSGIIKESKDFSNGAEYHIILDGESEERIYYEHNLEFENILDMEIDDYESYYEMAQVKWGFMSIKLAVYGKEGKYPHFHFYKGCAPEKGIPDEKSGLGNSLSPNFRSFFMFFFFTFLHIPENIFVKFSKKY